MDLPSAGGRTEAGSNLHIRAIVWVRGEIFEAESETADLWQPYWNGSDSPCHSHTDPKHGCRSPRKHSVWELEFRDCGAMPGWGLLLTAERRIEGMWRRRLWWEMPMEESQAAMEARWYWWVTCRRWSHHHSLSLPTCQHQQLNNREASLSTAWCTELQSRIPPRVLFKCLMPYLHSRTPARGDPLCAWNAEQQRRTSGKGAL